MLRKKHFPISNDYVTDPRKARVTDEWEIDTEHLDVYVNTILGTGAFAIVYKGKLNGRRPVDDIIQTIQLKSSISDEVRTFSTQYLVKKISSRKTRRISVTIIIVIRSWTPKTGIYIN